MYTYVQDAARIEWMAYDDPVRSDQNDRAPATKISDDHLQRP
jgi:hypothetical protein